MNYKELIKEAFVARRSSYAPYSHFNVGAALITSKGKIYKGCNIENVAHTSTCCAERTAFFKAISEDENDFKAIAIVGASEDTPEDEFDYCAPCGVCRQVMAEFCDLDEFEVILAKNEEEFDVYSINEILPLSFTNKNLDK